jgi:hypothetical protein
LRDYDRDIEYGLSQQYFKMERIIVPKTQTMISVLNKFLEKEDINEQSLALID